MAKSYVHFDPVKRGAYNKKRNNSDNIRPELSSLNESWTGQSLSARLAELKRLVKEKTGRAMQAKATPIREAIVLMNPDTTMDDLHRLAAKWREEFGIEVLQIHICRDSGHWNKEGRWIPNLYARMPADFTNHDTGKSLKLSPQQMAELQDVTAEVLGMERGASSNRKRLTALQYKIEVQRKELAAKQLL